MVLQGLYAAEMTDDPVEKILDDLATKHTVDAKSAQFMERLFRTTRQHREWTFHQIEERLENWEISRVALIDRLVLQMMVTEMVFLEDIPPKVSIAEGVEIARKYSTDDSGSFVNGILDAVYHLLEDLTVPTD